MSPMICLTALKFILKKKFNKGVPSKTKITEYKANQGWNQET